MEPKLQEVRDARDMKCLMRKASGYTQSYSKKEGLKLLLDAPMELKDLLALLDFCLFLSHLFSISLSSLLELEYLLCVTVIWDDVNFFGVFVVVVVEEFYNCLPLVSKETSI